MNASVLIMASAATVLALLCSGCAPTGPVPTALAVKPGQWHTLRDYEPREPRPSQAEVGPATHALLEMQRQSAGEHPRAIDGEQATRSYQRYLKSFEFPIPEKFETGVDTGQ